ncbi:hypothetical protein [Phocaeicola massiliensis]|uniref:hypothetical protein n=1 Tax=Phocaeicola massiliensis TaxID=204516 RepID=UPI001896D0DF|nr:hypothetical protein [Phocaeicola massiliensis]
MSLRTQESVPDGLGIDLPVTNPKGIGRPIPSCCPKEGRSRGAVCASGALPCRLGAKIRGKNAPERDRTTPQATGTKPNAATQGGNDTDRRICIFLCGQKR